MLDATEKIIYKEKWSGKKGKKRKESELQASKEEKHSEEST